MLASLHRERRDAAPALTREAERAIGRLLAKRWALRTVTVAAAGALVFAGAGAWISATRAADAGASASPTLTEAALPGVAQIPLGGGAEFASLNDYPICGEPAPEPNASERGFSIAASVAPTEDIWPNATVDSLWASIAYNEGDPGLTARGPLWVVLIEDGAIAGAAKLDVQRLREAVTPEADPAEFGVPALSDIFSCRKLSLRGPREYDLFPVEPGEYTAVAYTRIFATVESVALGQALPRGFEIDESAKLPGGVYQPGSYDCAVLEANLEIVRACLPDVVPGAQVDADRQTLSLMYDPTELGAPLDVTLVSEPLSLTLAPYPDDQEGTGFFRFDTSDATRFASGADVVCGAVVNDYSAFEATGESRFDTDGGRDDVSIEAPFPAFENLSPGIVQAQVMPWLASDGASVRLDAGARVVYMRYRSVAGEVGWPEYEVVGFAPLEMLGVIPYDRYAGPTNVRLRVGEPEWCAGIDQDDGRLSGHTAVVGTWTVTPVQGPQSKHERISTTQARLPLSVEIQLDG